jgi:hypothetical protein
VTDAPLTVSTAWQALMSAIVPDEYFGRLMASRGSG